MDLAPELGAALALALGLALEMGSVLAWGLVSETGPAWARVSDLVSALALGLAVATGLAARRLRSAERGGATLQSSAFHVALRPCSPQQRTLRCHCLSRLSSGPGPTVPHWMHSTCIPRQRKLKP